MGRDHVVMAGAADDVLFQSTRPRGARHDAKHFDGNLNSFNPRARVGRDFGAIDQAMTANGFNPRARVGRDLRLRQGIRPVKEFQSTRPRGARLSPNWTNTNYSTKQSYIQVTTRLTKITRPAVPQFRCQGTRANIPANRHHLPFARH